MKFKTSDNLIDLLVGQSLYSSPDVAMRELLQNAEDACHLQSLDEPSYVPEIVVRISVVENWVEVCDNGLGMDRGTFEDSFATIGASKSNSPKLQALLAKAGAGNRPIGQFGIGVLGVKGDEEMVLAGQAVRLDALQHLLNQTAHRAVHQVAIVDRPSHGCPIPCWSVRSP